MEIGDYLERVDNGGAVRYREVLENDPEGGLGLFNHASVDPARNRIQVDSNYAMDQMYENSSNPLEVVEEFISTVLDNQYEIGFQSADEKLEEINSRYNDDKALDLAKKKADKNSTITKAANAVAALSGAGFLGSTALGSVHGMGASATTGVVSSGVSARFQGARDRSITEAAEGLKDAYGNMRVEIT